MPDVLSDSEREAINDPLGFMDDIVSVNPVEQEEVKEEKPKKQQQKKSISEKIQEEIATKAEEPEAQADGTGEEEPAQEEQEKVTKTSEQGEPDELDEADYVVPFVDEFAERYGWDIPDDKKPKSFDEFFDFIENIIKANSRPDFASEEVEAFDRFIRAGGKREDFLNNYSKRLDLKDLDLTKKQNQEKVLRELYEEKGLSASQIDRIIERTERLDEMEEDAKDAYEELQKIRKEAEKKIVERTEQEQQENAQRTYEFQMQVRDAIIKNDQFYGLPMTRKEKEQLIPYIFAQDKNGMTQFQKDFENDPVGYTVFTALTYMQRKDLKKMFEKKAETTATKNIKERLKAARQSNKTVQNVEETRMDTDNDWLNDFKITKDE